MKHHVRFEMEGLVTSLAHPLACIKTLEHWVSRGHTDEAEQLAIQEARIRILQARKAVNALLEKEG